MPIAGAIVGHIGDTACYAVNTNNDRGIKANAGYALQWSIVGWLRDRQCCWYEQGEAIPKSCLKQYRKWLVSKEGAIAPCPENSPLHPIY